MTIALSTDHAGYQRLKELKVWLTNKGHECHDFGPVEFTADDDYPDYIAQAAKAVAAGECELGIIMGGSGQGEAMVANRFKGVRCAVYYGPAKATEPVDAEGDAAKDEFEIVRLTKQHNNANMLSLAGRFLDQPHVEQAVEIWLDTSFSEIERHVRRIAKIDSET